MRKNPKYQAGRCRVKGENSGNENKDRIKYTLNHRKAFRKVEKQLLGHNTIRSLFHDLDKVFYIHSLTIRKCIIGIDIIADIT